MKNFFKKIKSYGFWVSLSAALIILLDAFGNVFGFKIENKIVEDCVMSIAGILVVFGIVSMNDSKSDIDETEDKFDEKQNSDDENDMNK